MPQSITLTGRHLQDVLNVLNGQVIAVLPDSDCIALLFGTHQINIDLTEDCRAFDVRIFTQDDGNQPIAEQLKVEDPVAATRQVLREMRTYYKKLLDSIPDPDIPAEA